ncbi:T9SS type A sorting domain-containing protein [Flavobacterium sp. AS60]|uniref:T9SS type A sorting domain-containing protein n=1 Tax=Flavobacterium anseongense TaxID=2910677 RepID=UPI001F382D78|nr:T9SS type A sorting domain-containing protein [Flavobacterium sp. AS60]MCF6130500.1 T9SS type A sorting domain-containing protein [Flavobacterium sp. AS60]
MSNNYKLLKGFALLILMTVFSISGMQAQTTLINPAAEGGFNSGSTFAANGWTVANEGIGAVKWVVGTAVNSGAITGNSAYVSLDNGETNSYVGISGARTVFFYRDVVVPAGETNIALTFNWKSVASATSTWQVFAAPTTYTPVGTDLQTSVPATLTGATSITYGSVNAVTQTAFGFVPASFAGTTVRLIFMWSNSNGGGTNPPAAIDNISLVSRAGGVEIASLATGNFTNPATWDAGYVPSPADDVVINAGHTVTIDNRNFGANNLYIAGAGAVLQFGTISDEFTVYNDLLISGSGARFNVYEGTNGKSLKVGHNIDLASGGRLDVSVGNTSNNVGSLNLFGSTVQTIVSDGTGLIGGTVVATGTTNTAGIINQLLINNTSTATPNIDWQLNNVRIKSILRLNTARVGLGANKIYIGNFASMSSGNFTCTLGNGFIGGVISRWYGTSALGTVIDPGTDYNPNSTVLFPFLNATGQNRWAFLVNSGATTAGELAMSYTDANSMTTGLSVVDGSYTITDRYDGSWSVSKTGSTYVSAAGTYTLGLYGVGAYSALDGSSRVMNSGAVVGTHVNGTTSPFAVRKSISDADLTTSPFYIGIGNASLQAPTTKTSVASGDWSDAATWSPSGAPGCSDVITIASGHTVTVNSAGNNAAGVTINAGGTLVNASGDLTVGCSNNNAVLANNGTNTVSGGTLTVNGSVIHRTTATFNHTAGNIVVDGNAGGVAANSVGQGASLFKIETSAINLTGGTITIVDPLVNNAVQTTATSVTTFPVNTYGASGTFSKTTNAAATTGSTTVVMSGFNSNKAIYGVGQIVTGTGIAAGTTIVSATSGPLSNSPITLVISQGITADIAAGAVLNFASMNDGSYVIDIDTAHANSTSLAVGQIISGNGIQAGTTIVSMGFDLSGIGGIVLSQPLSGLTTSPIITQQAVNFSGASPNCSTIVLSAANPLLQVGQIVGGTGIQPGTTITAISGVRIDLSLPTTGAIVAPAAITIYDSNASSFAFVYSSTVHKATGLNHTIQIGDGVSTDQAPVTTNGFYTNFAAGGGVLSIGNFTINALDATNRFCKSIGILNVQNKFTIATGSSFLRPIGLNSPIYFGGDVENNGVANFQVNTGVNFSNYLNGAAVAITTPQTISGTGVFYNELNSSLAYAGFTSLTVNNTNASGVTVSMPSFRVGSLTMTAGVINTSTATPLYVGRADLSQTGFITGTFSNTCYINGPLVRGLATNSTSAFYSVYPVGKDGVYSPISLAVGGGADFKVEAFNTNSGTASANIANLSTARWTVERVGILGTLTDFNVRLGHTGVTNASLVVQASADQGTYDNVFGNTSVFTAGTPNTVNTVAAALGASFTGNFAYATAPTCTAVNPGNTIADTTITQIVTLQNSSSTGITAGSTTVTLQAANAAITVGLTVTGSGVPTGTTVAAISGTTLTLSQAATVTSTSQTTLTFSIVQTPTTLCGTQTVTLSIQNTQVGAGITYQWQASTDGGANYTDISGATAATYMATPTANTYYRCTVTCTNGPIVVNSTPVQVTFTNAVDTTTPATICGPGVANLEATTATGVINWYAAATGGVALATGNTYSPSIAATTTYYASAEATSTYTAGKVFAGTGTQTAPFSGLVFNTATNIRLNSVKVHPKQTAAAADAGAPITIKLFDKNGVQVPGTTAVTFTPAINTGTVSSSIFNTVVLNYDIPAGTGYRLLATNGLSSTNVLGRLSSFPAATPTASGAVAFTGSLNSFDGTADASYNNFFEWNVTEVCASPRVAVTATVNPATTNTTTVSECDSYTWAVNGTTYTTGGTYTSTVGCHTETLELTITPSTNNTTTVSECDSYTWAVNGTTYTTGGTYTSTVGCHTETLELTITPSTNNTTTVSECDSYTWAVNGTTYTTGGTYTSTVGCHTETLELTITPSTNNTTTVSECDSYTWAVNGTTYTTGGTYTSTVGCHTETLELTITPSTNNTTTVSECDSYTWAVNGTTYTTGGTYTSTVGCHTETLELTITPSTNNTTTVSECDSYTWAVNGTTYTTGGTYTSTVGCHTETLELTITPSTNNTTTVSECDSYTWAVNGTTYTTGGTYTSTVGCHTETLELTINSAATPTGNSTQIISVTDLNDATLEDLVVSPTNVIWYGSLADAQSQTNPLAITTVLTSGTTYYAVNVSLGCPSEPLAVTATVELGVGGFDNNSFSFYPNPTNGIVTLSYSNNIANVTVYNLIGQVVLDRKTNLNEVQIDLSSLTSSTYLVKVTAVDGNSKVIKVIKRN